MRIAKSCPISKEKKNCYAMNKYVVHMNMDRSMTGIRDHDNSAQKHDVVP